MEKVQKKFFICLILITFATLFPSIAVSDKAQSPSDEETKEYYQTLLQTINLINFSLHHIFYAYNNDMVNAGYFYILDNIDLDKVSFPEEIKDTYQEIINFFPNSGGAKEKQAGMEFLEKWKYRELDNQITEVVGNLENGNMEIPFSLMEYSKILYLRLLLDNRLNPLRNEQNEEIRDRILDFIKKWLGVIRPYFDNQILPKLPDAYLLENRDIALFLRNFYIQNNEVRLQSLNELQNQDKRLLQIPCYLLLYTFSARRAGDREQTELYINKFLECYRSILKKEIFLEIFYIGKLENLLQKDPELKDENIKQQILTTAETACKYVNDKNVIYKIFLSAIFHRLGKIDKTQELLSGINPEFIDKESKCEYNFYRLAMYDLEHGHDILGHMILLSKVLKRDFVTIEQLEEIKDSKIPEVLDLLGRNYVYTIENKDPEKGLAYIEEAHKLGFIDATYRLAYLYMYGDKYGIKKDEKKGFAYFQILAEKGEKEAFCELGKFYYEGKVVPQDFNKARECFEKARRNGEYWLGIMYSKGEGVPQDYQKAHMYFLNVVRKNYLGYETYNPYKDKAYIALGDLISQVKLML
ncbi:MAG: tetratricopeptide repeat protein [Candidatus Hydrogenedens sp.]